MRERAASASKGDDSRDQAFLPLSLNPPPGFVALPLGCGDEGEVRRYSDLELRAGGGQCLLSQSYKGGICHLTESGCPELPETQSPYHVAKLQECDTHIRCLINVG